MQVSNTSTASQYPSLSLTQKATGLLYAARSLEALGCVDSSFYLYRKSYEINPDLEVAQSLFWAAIRADNMILAQTVRERIEEVTPDRRAVEQADALREILKTPDFSLELLRELKTSRPSTQIAPIPDRIIYVLHNSHPYANGGYATRGHGLALGLQDSGFDVRCLTRPGYPVDTEKTVSPESVREVELVEGVEYWRDLQPRRRGGHQTRFYTQEAVDVFERRFRQLRPEAVLAASAYLSSLPALVAARRLGIPFIYEVRGFWEIARISASADAEMGPLVRMERFLEGEIARHADQVLTLTTGMRDELVRRGVDVGRITIVPNSCDPERFSPRERDTVLAARLGIPADVPVVGYIGTFVQYEGLDDLTRACGLLHRRGINFRLMIVGSENTGNTAQGPITKKIQQIAKEEGIESYLILPGRVPHHEVESYYSLIDIAPFPRKPQPVTEMVSPMKPLEALAMCKAVVVSSVQALVEMVHHNETGLVFEKGNIADLSDMVARLIADPELRATLGNAGRKWVLRERSWTRTAQRAKSAIARTLRTLPETAK